MKKMNEIEINNNRAIKISWAVLMVLLFLASVYDFLLNRKLGVLFILLCVQEIVYYISKILLDKNS